MAQAHRKNFLHGVGCEMAQQADGFRGLRRWRRLQNLEQAEGGIFAEPPDDFAKHFAIFAGSFGLLTQL